MSGNALWQVAENRSLEIAGIGNVRNQQFPAWGCSSVGRAVALQAIGQEFESPQLHQLLKGQIEYLKFEIRGESALGV